MAEMSIPLLLNFRAEKKKLITFVNTTLPFYVLGIFFPRLFSVLIQILIYLDIQGVAGTFHGFEEIPLLNYEDFHRIFTKNCRLLSNGTCSK